MTDYIYFVSFAHTNHTNGYGFGCADITIDHEWGKQTHTEVSNSIRKNLCPDSTMVIIQNFILIDVEEDD